MVELEWIDQVLGTGDGATGVFSAGASAYPIEPNTLSVEPKPAHLAVNEVNGTITAVYEPSALPQRETKVKIRFAWRPPRLRGATVRVTLPNGAEEWAPIAEVADAVHRGWMGQR